MDRPKWFRSDRDVEICDVVLFTKNEGWMVNTNQYGMVHEMELSRDGLIKKLLSSTEIAETTLTTSPIMQYVN